MRFNFEPLSFLLGVIVGSVFWWVIRLIQPLFKQMFESQREKQRERSLQASSNLETAYRKIIFRQTQGTHLAASLFALDEIVLPPRLLAPPSFVEPNAPNPHIDIVEQALPYLPDYPEIGAVYGAATLSLPEALSGGVNLILTGQPGSGKTTALAYLASQIVNRAPAVSSLHDRIPFFIHIADLPLPLNNPKTAEDFLAPISNKLAEMTGVFEAQKIPGFVEYAFKSGRALLLLDGVDELPQAAIPEVTAYLRVILRQFSKTRIIVTSAPEYMDGLLSLGFTPLTIMPWNTEQQKEFLTCWANLWQKYVSVEAWAQTGNMPVDSLLINRWLEGDNFGLTPLEYTLKVWAAFAGDARGARPTDAIEAHIRRLLPAKAPIEALYVVGAQASLNGISIFDSRRAREWTKSFEPAEPIQTGPLGAVPATGEAMPVNAEAGSGESNLQVGPKKASGQPAQTAAPSLISQLVISGLLAAHGGSRLRFAHPTFQGYLAGKGLGGGNTVETLLKQPAWAGLTTSLRYMAAFSDASSALNGLLSMEDHILLRPRLTAARLLRDAPKNAAWRGPVMGTLVQILQSEDHPIALRAQAMAAFALSGDPNAAALFRQLMLAPSNTLRQLAAFGAGVYRDPKAVDALINVISTSAGAARQAACLALVEIATPQALEAVATALLRGDEQLRIAAAEALANHPTDGREALREGIASEDILVRRAIVYGLARVKEEWGQDLLTQTQIKDEQWVVRNAAVEIMDARQRMDAHIPRRLPAPSDNPWLIEFAGKFGMGVTPGDPAIDVFLLALKNDNPEYREAALYYLKRSPTEGVLAALYPYLYGDDPEMREAVFHALDEIARGGTPLPQPMQFGLG